MCKVLGTNKHPGCGGKLYVLAHYHYMGRHEIDEKGIVSSDYEIEERFDDDAELTLYCENCGALNNGAFTRDKERNNRFEFYED